jgi:hypothetical protein
LSRFDFVIEYHLGRRNPADGPLRRPDYNTSLGEKGVISLLALQQKLKTALSYVKSRGRLTSAIILNLFIKVALGIGTRDSLMID